MPAKGLEQLLSTVSKVKRQINPKLEKLVATIRSCEISACLVLQAQSQLKAIYKDNADADKRNTFDIEAFLSARLKLKPDEVCDVYEVDTEGV